MLNTEPLLRPIASPATPAIAVTDIARETREPKRPRNFHSEDLGESKSETTTRAEERTQRLPLDPEALRRHAWEIGERRAHTRYSCQETYLNLLVVSPGEAFVVWRVTEEWIQSSARRKGDRWKGSRLVVRLYDVTCIVWNGLNAHRMRDVDIQQSQGEQLLRLSLAGTTQIAELGYLLRDGEFVPAARSPTTVFPATTTSNRQDCAALYVDDRLAPEPVDSPWEGAAYVRERTKPQLRKGLRIAMLSFEAEAMGHAGPVATFVTSLGAALREQGEEVHVFVPAREPSDGDFELAEVRYHPLKLEHADTPVASALAFARALEARLKELPPFDFFHMQEWLTALAPWLATRPAALAVTSIERTRSKGTQPPALSEEIERLERDVARSVECLLTPEWLRDPILSDFGVDGARVHSFPIEGRPIDEWEAPLDYGSIKAQIGFNPTDRMLLFVGPLESEAGPDLVVEALPTVISRTPNVRIAFVGCGGMHAHLLGRAQKLGLAHSIRLLGHMELPRLIPLLRASEALVLPSRRRVAQDEGVVGLARRAGRAVLTTHGGPSHLVQHEQNGLVAYDNPPSIVWGLSRLLDDARHTEAMGRSGWQQGEGASWNGLARIYGDICAQAFSELTDGSDRLYGKMVFERGRR